MRAVSDRLLAALTGAHTMVARARVCTAYQTGIAPVGTEVPIENGDVMQSAGADVRGTMELIVSQSWANTAGALIAPYGNEVYVERGLRVGNETEWVGLGYYRIEDVEQDDAPRGMLRIAGKDRMAGLVEAKLLSPRQFTAAHTVQDVADDLVLEVYPDAELDLDADVAAAPLGRDGVVEQDRYRFLADLATAHGKIMFWDYRGAFRMTEPPDPDVPVWSIAAGEYGTLVRLARSMSRERVYNAVVATGEGADTTEPVRGVAIDNNPTSATYWFGRFGKRPRFFTSPFITDQVQARQAAEKLLQRSLGLPYSVQLTAVPNPALEPLDAGIVTTAQGQERHVLQTVTIPLVADQPMTGSTREQTDILIGVV